MCIRDSPIRYFFNVIFEVVLFLVCLQTFSHKIVVTCPAIQSQIRYSVRTCLYLRDWDGWRIYSFPQNPVRGGLYYRIFEVRFFGFPRLKTRHQALFALPYNLLTNLLVQFFGQVSKKEIEVDEQPQQGFYLLGVQVASFRRTNLNKKGATLVFWYRPFSRPKEFILLYTRYDSTDLTVQKK